MTISIRPPAGDEIDLFLKTVSASFHEEMSDANVEREKALVEPERLLLAWDDDRPVGATGAFRFALGIPGGELPTAGVTMTGVLSSHRRRGILTALMRHQLQDARRWGEPLAALWASESNIYGRFGYGLAAWGAHIEIERDRAGFLEDDGPEGRVLLLDREEALKTLPSIYARVRALRPGMPSRSAVWWSNHTLGLDPDDRRSQPPLKHAIVELDGRAEAYALYRVRLNWPQGHPAGVLEVEQAMGTSTRAVKELWRFLFGIDLVARIDAHFEPVDTPLFVMVKEMRRLRARLYDALWVRVVDIESALSKRSYAAAGELVFGLEDHFCPWNAGTWKLETSGSETTVARTEEHPDLEMRAADLGAVFLGGMSFSQLRDGGAITELTPEAAARGDDLFRVHPAPWCPEIF
jgi:predicted acetyltransferase